MPDALKSPKITNIIRGGRLKRHIPARTETVVVNWINPSFMEVAVYNHHRSNRKLSLAQTCWWCKAVFEDEEMLALASFVNRGVNKLICQDCAAAAAPPEVPSED